MITDQSRFFTEIIKTILSFRKQVEQSCANDHSTSWRRSCSTRRIFVRNRWVGWPDSLEHCWTLRSKKQQMDCGGSHVDSTKASWLRCVQQLYLRCRWTRRLHGTLKCRAIQVRILLNFRWYQKSRQIIFSPVTNSWSPIVAMTSRRSGVGLAVVNGQLYAVGGFDGTAYLKTIEVYDPESNQWRLCGCMNYRRLGGGVGVMKHQQTENYMWWVDPLFT